jgi:hypothetical protein
MSKRSFNELHPYRRSTIEDSENEDDRQENIHFHIGVPYKDDEYKNKLTMSFMNENTNQSTNCNNKKLIEDLKLLPAKIQDESDKYERESTTNVTRESRLQKDKFPSCFKCCDYNHSADEHFLLSQHVYMNENKLSHEYNSQQSSCSTFTHIMPHENIN